MTDTMISVAYKTERAKRLANEDSCLVLTADDLKGQFDGLYIVADGMGGRASGAIASSIAVSTVKDSFIADLERAALDPSESLSKCLRAANSEVFRQAGVNPELKGMGTTCVAAAVKGEKAYVAHLGDSRAYLLRDGKIRQLTEDHSFVAEKVKSGEITEDEARKSRFRNIITRAVGLGDSADPEVAAFDLQKGDVLLLCTDGLTGPLSAKDIEDILCSSSTADEASDRLVNAALRKGGSDNITTIVAAYRTPQKVSVARESRSQVTEGRGRRVHWAIPGFVMLVLGMGIGLYPGYKFLPKYLNPPPPRETTAPQRDLAHAVYNDPVALIYLPLQGRAISLDKKNRLHVLDNSGQLLLVDTSGRIISGYPSIQGLGKSSKERLPMLATDSQNNVYISDTAGRRILKLGADGLSLGSIGEGKLDAPEALAVGDDGTIYVIDAGRLKAIRIVEKQVGEPAVRE